MARIAVDETRHVSLAWAVAEWASVSLDQRARASDQGAPRDRLSGGSSAIPASFVPAGAGAGRAPRRLPTPSQSLALVRGMTSVGWGEARFVSESPERV